MAALVVVNEPLVTRMVNYGVVQRRIPSFRPRRAAPSRLAEAHQARKQRSDPLGPNTRSRQKSGASVSQFRRHVLIELLPRLGNSIDPECERSRFKRLGNRFIEAWRFYCSKSLNGASLYGSGKGQAARSKKIPAACRRELRLRNRP